MKFSLVHSVTVFLSSLKLANAQVEPGSLHERNLQTCYIGDINIRCEHGSDCPPCWTLKRNRYHCYDYVNGFCPNWSGMFDRTKYAHYPANTCHRGNISNLLCQAGKERCPPCWIKSGNNYACFDYVEFRCPWPVCGQVFQEC